MGGEDGKGGEVSSIKAPFKLKSYCAGWVKHTKFGKEKKKNISSNAVEENKPGKGGGPRFF